MLAQMLNSSLAAVQKIVVVFFLITGNYRSSTDKIQPTNRRTYQTVTLTQSTVCVITVTVAAQNFEV